MGTPPPTAPVAPAAAWLERVVSSPGEPSSAAAAGALERLREAPTVTLRAYLRARA